MNNDMNNQNSIWQSAMDIIARDSRRCKPSCVMGMTGPTGPTERLVNSSNK